ncbi:hypothetical protein BASA83_002952 [Batrachochytrium salamandrivorans]|nr:hypothetical protein BASA83_002952 [Batrachochytrium salamandrivorans]
MASMVIVDGGDDDDVPNTLVDVVLVAVVVVAVAIADADAMVDGGNTVWCGEYDAGIGQIPRVGFPMDSIDGYWVPLYDCGQHDAFL